MEAVLTIVGMPLDEAAPLSGEAIAALQRATLVIGESRKVAFRYLKQAGGAEAKRVLLLDPPRADTQKEIADELRRLHGEGGEAVLFSDVGMPLLFDPGRDVLTLCRKLGFTVRSVAGPTSWGMAAALSGYLPPFHIVGFLPRDTEERIAMLQKIKDLPAHLVLMDTPYRFRILLEQALKVMGRSREAFLAWEIAKPTERLLWGRLDALENKARAEGLTKGEFVLVISK